VKTAAFMVLALTLTVAARGIERAVPADDSDAKAFGAEVLQLAIDNCLNGDAVQALALFKAIREQLDPPDAVRQIIDAYEVTGCRPNSNVLGRWGFQVGFGGDSNVNQGISATSLTLGSGSNPLELPLGDAYRPKSSLYAVVGIDRTFGLGTTGTGQLTLQSRANQAVPELNLTSALAAAAMPFEFFGRPGRIQLDVGATWLGGQYYQRAGALGLQWLPSLTDRSWMANLATIRTNYSTQSNQDSQLVEAGVWRERMVALGVGLFGGVSGLYDHAINQRAGGDRYGWRYQFGASAAWGNWQIQPRVNVLAWRSSEVFAPGLIDEVRQHRIALLDVQLIRPVSANQQIVVEWRARIANDNVPLYAYRGQTLAIYWRYQQ